jgi:RNA polymerase sigma-70 factor (ECF subfamily)
VQTTFDLKWKRSALGGNAAAVSELANFALGPLYRFCLYRLGRDEHLCEDVVQETLVRAIGQLDRYEPDRGGDNIFPWLCGLARNEIKRVLRDRSSQSLEVLWSRMDKELLNIFAKLETQPFGDELLARAETREMVNAAMSQLPPHYSLALELKYVVGKSVREIAQAWKTSEKAVESQLTRAREAFRATFLALAHNMPGVEGPKG